MLKRSVRVKVAGSRCKVQAEEKGAGEEKQSGLEMGKKRKEKEWVWEGWMLLGAASFYPHCLSSP